MTLKETAKTLEAAGVPDAGFDAAELICRFENVSRALAMTGDFSSEELFRAVERRKSGEPLQYILGEWDFMGFTFKVTPDCLIPRFDTEVLCGYLVENLPENGRFADLCTGTGCIAVAALKMRNDAAASAVELYPETISVAKENAETLGVSDRLELILADVCTDCLSGEYDIIVSNPPYVTSEEMKALPREVKFEPPHALTDGGDGLSVIRKIAEIYPRHLKEGGSLAIEIGSLQGEALRTIAEENSLTCQILRDTGNRDRVAVLKRKQKTAFTA